MTENRLQIITTRDIQEDAQETTMSENLHHFRTWTELFPDEERTAMIRRLFKTMSHIRVLERTRERIQWRLDRALRQGRRDFASLLRRRLQVMDGILTALYESAYRQDEIQNQIHFGRQDHFHVNFNLVEFYWQVWVPDGHSRRTGI